MRSQKSPKTVLAISDGSDFYYTSHEKLEGRGALKRGMGLVAHSCLIVTPEEEILGLTYQKFWGRKPEDYEIPRTKRKIEDKESYRWLESFSQAQSYLSKNKHVI